MNLHPCRCCGRPSHLDSARQERTISLHLHRRSISLLLALAICLSTTRPLWADPVPVRRSQGTFHGFLVLTTLEGTILAAGDLVQVAHGDRVTSRLTYHFRDGSLDDETTVYLQHKVFSLVSDHHIQRGPSFPKPLDLLIDATTGQITTRDKDGKTIQNHLDLSSDLANGLPLVLLLNLDPAAPPTRVSMIAPTEKPRLIHLLLASDGEDTLVIAGVQRKATNFRIKIELGGITGLVAPIVGKQPPDFHVWILGGEAPAFVKEEGPFYQGGPIWRVELAAPKFPAQTTPTK